MRATSRLLVYGANGYTGSLITRMAAGHGIEPIVAGRSAGAVEVLGARFKLESRVFDVADTASHLNGVAVVLNCAGPFSRTHAPVVDACIAAGVHYIDVTGEIDVFESIAARDADARAAGVMLLPGAGFDVVPTDCLAAHVAALLPDATSLQLGISSSGRLSRGTMTTALENSAGGGRVRRDGRIVAVPAAWRSREIDFGDGPRSATTIAWGDVATAFHSTGIPNIEVYAAVSAGARNAMRVSRHLGWLLRRDAVQSFLKKRVRSGPEGPSGSELRYGESRVWARAENAAGEAVEARLTGPNAYLLTAHAALLAARRALNGDAPPGYRTPSSAYGADFILDVPGTARSP